MINIRSATSIHPKTIEQSIIIQYSNMQEGIGIPNLFD